MVVEGVESTAQLALLADWGCDLYQGFLGAGGARRGRARPLRRRVDGRSRLGRLQLLFLRFAGRERPAPGRATICSAPRSRASAVGQSRLIDQLAVGPQLGRALQPLDIGEQPGEVGEAAVDEGHHRAPGADVELGDARRRGS